MKLFEHARPANRLIQFVVVLLLGVLPATARGERYIVAAAAPPAAMRETSDAKAIASRATGREVERAFESKGAVIAAVRMSPAEAEALSAQRGLRVEPDFLFQPSFTPDDPGFGLQWGYFRIGMEPTWDVVTGDPASVIAVMDTGADLGHPDLHDNIWVNPGEIYGNGIDDDGNGYVDDIMGYDFGDNDNVPQDECTHGTHVSGTISAVTNNARGVAGIAFSSKLLPLKIASANGYIYLSAVLEALQYAINLKRAGTDIAVVNMSFGSPIHSQIFEDMLREAGTLGIMVSAAAGNNGQDSDIVPTYPAQYNLLLENVISVGAIEQSGALAFFSNHGAAVNLAAPGVNVLSTMPVCSFGSYGYLSGTSMAAPHVTGVLDLMHVVKPSLNVRALRNVLLKSVRDNASLHGMTSTGGELDAFTSILNAMNAVNTWKASGTVRLNGAPLEGVTVDAGSSSVVTNAAGYYEFPELTEGTDVTVRASAAGYSFAPEFYQWIMDSDKTGDFEASPLLFSVTLKVTLDSKPLGAASLSIKNATFSTTAKSNRSGVALVRAIPKGTYNVSLKARRVALSKKALKLVVKDQNNMDYTIRYRRGRK